MMRGDGRVFSRKGSRFLWCAYYVRGEEQRESTGTTDERKAWQFLRRRMQEVGADLIGAKQFVGPQAERIKIACGVMADDKRKTTCDCLCCALERDYRLRSKNSPQNISNFKRIRKDFALQRAASLTSEQIDQYIDGLLKEDYAPASINRLTQLLGQAFNLALRQKRLTSCPYVRRLSEAGNVRQGFFSETEFRAVASSLPSPLDDFALFGYLTGWRKREIVSLTWQDIDGDVIGLRAVNAKIRVARSLPTVGELAELIERRRAARQIARADGSTALCNLVFHRDGAPVTEFRKAWYSACVLAGIGKFVCRKCASATDATHKCMNENCAVQWKRDQLKYVGRIFHDFRRTAVRDMVRAGVRESAAMSISGHKTRSMFDRYNIHDERDQREALRTTQAYREQQASAQRNKIIVRPQQSKEIH
jgi:integrase